MKNILFKVNEYELSLRRIRTSKFINNKKKLNNFVIFKLKKKMNNINFAYRTFLI